jgi:hypothetical protein
MSTLMIFTDFEDLPHLFLFDEDITRFDGIVINTYINPDKHTSEETERLQGLQDELNALMYDTEGRFRTDRTLFYEDYRKQGADLPHITDIVRCGFAP